MSQIILTEQMKTNSKYKIQISNSNSFILLYCPSIIGVSVTEQRYRGGAPVFRSTTFVVVVG